MPVTEPAHSATDDLALILSAALRAGEIAARHFGNGPASRDKGDGQGPVSDADIEFDRMLHAVLTGARPDYGWLSEETPDTPARLGTAAQFIVDPIDGTRAFLDGQRSFAHAIGVVRNGIPVAGVVHLPLMNLTYAATKGGGARLNGAPLATPARAALPGARILANRASFEPALWPGGPPPVERHFRPSLAWRICLVAEGAFDGIVTLRPAWEWDIAAAALILTEAGGCITDSRGAALAFNAPHPQTQGIIGGPLGVHRGLMHHLAVPG